MGVDIRGAGKGESIPIKINGGSLRGGNVSIDGSLSSQFISALLITCPLLSEDTNLKLKGKTIVSKDYVDMTLKVLSDAGIKIAKKADKHFFIRGSQKFKGLKSFHIPSDYGLAAFMMAGASLMKSDVVLKGYFNDKYVQADGNIFQLLRRMGVKFTKTSKAIRIKGPANLKGGRFSLKACPDLVPIVAVLSLFGKGMTCLYDIKHARVKESDRISDLRKELLKIGANVSETEDEITIYPAKTYKKNCVLDPHNDHRLAMAFSILGLKVGVRVKDIECVSKSYPDFIRDLKLLNGKCAKF